MPYAICIHSQHCTNASDFRSCLRLAAPGCWCKWARSLAPPEARRNETRSKLSKPRTEPRNQKQNQSPENDEISWNLYRSSYSKTIWLLIRTDAAFSSGKRSQVTSSRGGPRNADARCDDSNASWKSFPWQNDEHPCQSFCSLWRGRIGRGLLGQISCNFVKIRLCTNVYAESHWLILCPSSPSKCTSQ